MDQTNRMRSMRRLAWEVGSLAVVLVALAIVVAASH
jgi:hypothetical protein